MLCGSDIANFWKKKPARRFRAVKRTSESNVRQHGSYGMDTSMIAVASCFASAIGRALFRHNAVRSCAMRCKWSMDGSTIFAGSTELPARALQPCLGSVVCGSTTTIRVLLRVVFQHRNRMRLRLTGCKYLDVFQCYCAVQMRPGRRVRLCTGHSTADSSAHSTVSVAVTAVGG